MNIFSVDAHKKNTEIITEKGAQWLRGKYAPFFLAVISFAESVFVPIIIDPFLIAVILANPTKWKRDTTIAISASVFGGIVAYFIGALFFQTWGVHLINFYGLNSAFDYIAAGVDKSAFVFVLIGALTPIPYKLVALAGGLLHISFVTFIIASVIGRVLRLGLVGIATHHVGPKALPAVRRNLHHIAAGIGLLLIAYLVWQFII